ncbi:hypothetical protein DOTSEDRAFT_85429 [Dothistroma septosporum NZE10]|uniref:Major facilitator superfamily (MFS) profile domain-containing protein n=1 Tax=Dothistroma septosporum (strain NZE10 / CBS 128990) TaxID=675120 RepID=N1Q5E7_DOTSN|nr:hypothetical protein DOTSEDRAFT_85429 [Dothistroma septosporum NZE10]
MFLPDWKSITHLEARKSYDSAPICFLEVFVTLISNTGSSIAHEQSDFDTGRTIMLVCFTTMYVTTISEYALLCLVVAARPVLSVVVVGRFGSGFLSTMPTVVAAGSIENMWDGRARIWSNYLWITTAVLGLAFDFVVATWISTSADGWVKAMARQTGFHGLTTDGTDSTTDFRTFVKTSLTLPVELSATESIRFVHLRHGSESIRGDISLPMALPEICTPGYEFSRRQASFLFVAIAGGIAFTSLRRIFDIHITNQRRRTNQVVEPDDKLLGLYITAPHQTVRLDHLRRLGSVVVEIDAVLSASAHAPMAFLRAIVSAISPPFGRQMFERLGANFALLVLAEIATAYCAVAAFPGICGRRAGEVPHKEHELLKTDATAGMGAFGRDDSDGREESCSTVQLA